MFGTDYSFRSEQVLLVILSGIILTLSTISLTTSVKADNVNAGVYAKDSKPFGISYENWINKWWQWNMGIPSAEHPRDHYTPSRCTINQGGPVWFLADLLSGKEENAVAL